MAQIATRVTEEEKQRLLAYCEKHEMKISGLIRIALKKYLQDEEIFDKK